MLIGELGIWYLDILFVNSVYFKYWFGILEISYGEDLEGRNVVVDWEFENVNFLLELVWKSKIL